MANGIFADPLLIVSIMIGFIAGIGIPVIYALTRTRDLTLRGSLKLEGYSEDLAEVRDNVKAVLNRFDETSRRTDNHDWRLQQMEKELQELRDKKIGSLERQLGDLRLTKARTEYLEEEIRALKENRQSRNGSQRSPI